MSGKGGDEGIKKAAAFLGGFIIPFPLYTVVNFSSFAVERFHLPPDKIPLFINKFFSSMEISCVVGMMVTCAAVVALSSQSVNISIANIWTFFITVVIVFISYIYGGDFGRLTHYYWMINMFGFVLGINYISMAKVSSNDGLLVILGRTLSGIAVVIYQMGFYYIGSYFGLEDLGHRMFIWYFILLMFISLSAAISWTIGYKDENSSGSEKTSETNCCKCCKKCKNEGTTCRCCCKACPQGQETPCKCCCKCCTTPTECTCQASGKKCCCCCCCNSDNCTCPCKTECQAACTCNGCAEGKCCCCCTSCTEQCSHECTCSEQCEKKCCCCKCCCVQSADCTCSGGASQSCKCCCCNPASGTSCRCTCSEKCNQKCCCCCSSSTCQSDDKCCKCCCKSGGNGGGNGSIGELIQEPQSISALLMFPISNPIAYSFNPSIAPYQFLGLIDGYKVSLLVTFTTCIPSCVFTILKYGVDGGKYSPESKWCDGLEFYNMAWCAMLPLLSAAAICLIMLHYPYCRISRYFFRTKFRIYLLSVTLQLSNEVMLGIGMGGVGNQGCSTNGTLTALSLLLAFITLVIGMFISDGYLKTYRRADRDHWPTKGYTRYRGFKFWFGSGVKEAKKTFREVFTLDMRKLLMLYE